MRSLALLACLLGGGVVEVEPTPLEWEQLSPSVFDLRWRLPKERQAPGRDLLADLERLVALRFEARGPEGERFRCLADLFEGIASAERPSVWLDRVLATDPQLERSWGRSLRELLIQDQLLGEGWDPGRDGARDGLLIGESWDLSSEGAPWDQLEVDPTAQQGAALIRSDLATIKSVENDFSLYPENVGADYEEIYPVQGGYRRGLDPGGREFAAVQLYFRCDLPLWYSDYSCDLRMLTCVDEADRLECHIYSVSEDFHYLAGRDVFLPLRTTDSEPGKPCGYLVVRQYGFDLDGVPDRDSDVRGALRGSLGNLKRRAEAAAREAALTDPPEARVPSFPVRGSR